MSEQKQLVDEWTRDLDGNYVDWTKPPYRGPGGKLSLVCPGEDPKVLEQPGIYDKRIAEYYRLVFR